MDLTHTFTVPTAVDDAWDLFMDLEAVGNCFPGATVTEVSDDGFAGSVKVKLGPISLVYTGSGSFVERDDAAHRAVIEAKGKDKRGNGTAGANVVLELTPDGEGTRADVVTDLSVTGKPAQFGRGVMQDVSDKLLQAFIACVEQQLTSTSAEAAPEPASAETVSPASEEAAPGTTPDTAAGPGTAAAAADAGVSGRFDGSPPSAAKAWPGGQPPPGDTSETHTAGTSARGSAAYSTSSRPEQQDALDLGSAVLPVLVNRYGRLAAAGLVGLVIGWLLGRRRT
ncbi:MAG: SRPBCC family protein [Micrococcales bacterium]|nr:SRPBCC family protein [Micrococcales bacterium]